MSKNFLWWHPSHFFAYGFGIGLIPWAPGTVASFFGWGFYYFLLQPMPESQVGAFLILVLVASYLSVEKTVKYLTEKGYDADPGAIVMDEILAVLLMLWVLGPVSLIEQFIALVLFRIFDIVKPFYIGKFEKKYKNVYGVLGDDILAAIYVISIMALVKMAIV